MFYNNRVVFIDRMNINDSGHLVVHGPTNGKQTFTFHSK